MQTLRFIGCLFIGAYLTACSTTKNLNIADSSATFTNIEISKKINERWQVQLEASGSASTGHTFYPASPTAPTTRTDTMSANTGSISMGGFEYEAPSLAYDYSAKHATLSIGYDFIHAKKFGFVLSGGVSDYDYSVTAKMKGTVNVYSYHYNFVTLTEEKYIQTGYDKSYYLSEGTVTDKEFLFKYSAIGAYVNVEPHYQFNDHFALSARLATSFSKHNSNRYAMTGAELGIRFIYTPIEHLELYTGYQAWSINNDLNSIVDKSNSSDVHLGHPDLNIDLRGVVAGVALRF